MNPVRRTPSSNGQTALVPALVLGRQARALRLQMDEASTRVKEYREPPLHLPNYTNFILNFAIISCTPVRPELVEGRMKYSLWDISI
jgi:hypothetical protein